MIVFGIHCNFFIVLPIRLETCRSNIFLFFTRLLPFKQTKNIRSTRLFGGVSEELRARAHPTGIGRTICPGLLFLRGG